MSKFTFFIFIITLGLLYESCVSEHIYPEAEVCFEDEILPIFISNCTQSGCHNSIDREADYSFNSYTEIISQGITPGNYKSSTVYTVLNAVGEKAMPQLPYDRLADDQVILIARWIEQGAKNTTCVSSCDTSRVTYSGTIRPILKNYCLGCHGGGSPLGGVNYNDYTGVFPTAVNGTLMGSINHKAGYIAMPKDGIKLSACRIKQFEIWIAQGAPNN